MPMHNYYWGGDSWAGWIFVHSAFWLLLLGLLAWGVLALTRRSRTTGEDLSALDILNDRYARGEIDREEYLQRKKDILQARDRPPLAQLLLTPRFVSNDLPARRLRLPRPV